MDEPSDQETGRTLMTLNMALMGLGGGAIIGAASLLLMLAGGRIAGISGIVAGLATNPDRSWRAFFLTGLIVGGGLLFLLVPQWFANTTGVALPIVALAGLLVGFGTRLGSGCTSGHGVCGISRFSKRSIVATVVFIATGAVTVGLVRVLGGGA